MLKAILCLVTLLILTTADHKLQEYKTIIAQPIWLSACGSSGMLVANHNEVQIIREGSKSTIYSFNESVQHTKCLSSGLLAVATSQNFYLFDHEHHINSSIPLNGCFPMAIAEDSHDSKLYLLAVKNKTTFTQFEFEGNELHQFQVEDLELGRNIMAIQYVYHHDFIFVSDYERNLNIYEEPFESKEILRIDGLTAPAHMAPLDNTTAVLVYDNTGNFAIVKDGKVTMTHLKTHYHIGALCKADSFVLANNQEMEVHMGKTTIKVERLGIVGDLKGVHCSVKANGALQIDLLDVYGAVRRLDLSKQSGTNWFVILICLFVIGGLIYWLKVKCFTKEEEHQGLMHEEMVTRQ